MLVAQFGNTRLSKKTLHALNKLHSPATLLGTPYEVVVATIRLDPLLHSELS